MRCGKAGFRFPISAYLHPRNFGPHAQTRSPLLAILLRQSRTANWIDWSSGGASGTPRSHQNSLTTDASRAVQLPSSKRAQCASCAKPCRPPLIAIARTPCTRLARSSWISGKPLVRLANQNSIRFQLSARAIDYVLNRATPADSPHIEQIVPTLTRAKWCTRTIARGLCRT